MKSRVDGSKYFVFPEKGVQLVNPFFVLSPPCRHSKTAPYLPVLMPRCVLYHSFIFLGSLHLKKIPPMPVTLFRLALSRESFVMTDLKAKPKPNDVANARTMKTILFIVRSSP